MRCGVYHQRCHRQLQPLRVPAAEFLPGLSKAGRVVGWLLPRGRRTGPHHLCLFESAGVRTAA